MDAERWEKIQELFEAAVDLEPSLQIKYLKDECQGDEALQNEVLSLIRADNEKNSLLDNQASKLFDIKTPKIEAGRKIGAYEIVEQIAMGGMGAVYLAERADGQFKQEVALKLIKRGMDSEEILRRFKAERQILASLNHPNIARLIDGGLTEDGIPWFTMEYVDGEPIDEYCDKNRLNIRERLDLFLTVCRTVQYAQQNLVIHRDLKPSNIIVTADSTVKLLDFGIAKVLGDGSEDQHLQNLTRTGLRVMTPGYASPEQVRGDVVSTSSDVYSLGVVLYRLLTGSSPYSLENYAPLELERVICHTDPQKPSAAVTASADDEQQEMKDRVNISSVCEARSTQKARLRRQLAGDLDNICLMALRKEPERRYQSAGLLADEIERYLNGHPVRARKDSLGYRASKFLARHRVGVVVGLASFVIIAALISVYTVKLANERDRAKVEAAKAAEVSDFLISIFDYADPNESRGEQITARELLDNGAKRIDDELSDQPETQAIMLATIGKVYQQLGDLEKADTLLTSAYNIQVNQLGLYNPETATNIHDLAVLAHDRGELDRAELLYRQALEIDSKLWGEENAEVAADLNDLGALLNSKGETEAARDLFEKALALRLRLFGEMNVDVAHSMNHLGGVLHELGEDERAEKLLRKGLAIREKIYDTTHFEVVASMGKLAGFLTAKKKYDEALTLYQKALSILHKLVGENHYYVGGITNSLGNVYFYKGDYAKADSLHRKSLEIVRATLPEGHVNRAYPLVQLGYDLIKEKRPEEAEGYLRKALAIRKQALPPGHVLTLQTEALLGVCLAQLLHNEEARKLLEGSLGSLIDKSGHQNIINDAGQSLMKLYNDNGYDREADSLKTLLANLDIK